MSNWNPKANSLFAQAIELESADQRSDFLDDACAGDAELRSAVEQILKAHNDAGSFLEQPPAEFLPTIATGDFDAADQETAQSPLDFLHPSEKPGCIGTLGHYEVVGTVGSGGMGLVFKAHDPKLNRVVAIKVLAPEMVALPTAVKRFLREARAAAAVSHKHVVTIHAIDEKHRPPFLAMEFVAGKSLQEKIDSQGAMDVKEILRIGMQTAAGLVAAHKQGLVHRDIKPANILLENGIERVKLTDFGLARAVDDVGVTRTGQIAGTPQYMSPEQAQGQRVDHRTDLFSLGCVLYAMCTGRAAFRADSAVAVMHSVVHDAPRPIRELNEDIPDWLCDIVDKLLAKDADDRFDSAEEVEDLLGRHLAHLQQPGNVPQPKRIGPTSEQLRDQVQKINVPLPLRICGILLFVLGVLGAAMGGIVLCVATIGWYAAGAIPSVSNMLFYVGMIAIGLLVGDGGGCMFLKRNYQRALLGCLLSFVLALMMKLDDKPNLLALLGFVPGAIALYYLLQPEIRDLFRVQSRERSTGKSVDALGAEPRSWIRRVPIPAWLALLLFTVVYVAALTEWTGLSHELGARPNGIGFYLLATGFVLVWGLIALATRLVRGRREASSSLPPTPVHFVTFFANVILFTGLFVWQWAELGNPAERERLLGFFVGHGSITIQLRNPDATVVFNGEKVEVYPDGRAIIRPSDPGSFVYVATNDGKQIMRGEGIVHFNTNLEARIPKEATLVTVTGPIRGNIGEGLPDAAQVRPAPQPDRKRKEPVEPSFVKYAGTWWEDDGMFPVLCLDVSPDGKWVVSGHRGTHVDRGEVRLCEVWEDGKKLNMHGVPVPKAVHVWDVAFSPDGKQFAWVQEDGVLGVAPANSFARSKAFQFEKVDRPLRSVCWSPDGKSILTGSTTVIYVWDAEKRAKPLFHEILNPTQTTINDIAYSADGSQIAAGGGDGHVTIFRTDRKPPSWQHLLSRRDGSRPHKGPVHAVAFSPDGSMLFSAGEDGVALGWDTKTGKERSKGFGGDARAKRALAFSADGSLLAQAGDNLQIIIDETKERGAVKAMLGSHINEMHKNDITSLAFTRDGRYLISGSEDGTIKWWELAEPVSESEQE